MAAEALPVTIARDGDGRVTYIDVHAKPPRRKWRDGQPSEEMAAAFENFYGMTTGRLRYSQVAAMLEYRSFGIACSAHILAGQTQDARQLFARLIAAFVARDGTMARDVRRYQAAIERRGSHGDVRDCAQFEQIAAFCRQACAMLSEQGITLKGLGFIGAGDLGAARVPPRHDAIRH